MMQNAESIALPLNVLVTTNFRMYRKVQIMRMYVEKFSTEKNFQETANKIRPILQPHISRALPDRSLAKVIELIERGASDCSITIVICRSLYNFHHLFFFSLTSSSVVACSLMTFG